MRSVQTRKAPSLWMILHYPPWVMHKNPMPLGKRQSVIFKTFISAQQNAVRGMEWPSLHRITLKYVPVDIWISTCLACSSSRSLCMIMCLPLVFLFKKQLFCYKGASQMPQRSFSTLWHTYSEYNHPVTMQKTFFDWWRWWRWTYHQIELLCMRSGVNVYWDTYARRSYSNVRIYKLWQVNLCLHTQALQTLKEKMDFRSAVTNPGDCSVSIVWCKSRGLTSATTLPYNHPLENESSDISSYLISDSYSSPSPSFIPACNLRF